MSVNDKTQKGQGQPRKTSDGGHGDDEVHCLFFTTPSATTPPPPPGRSRGNSKFRRQTAFFNFFLFERMNEPKLGPLKN